MTGGSQGRAHMSATSREVAGAGERAWVPELGCSAFRPAVGVRGGPWPTRAVAGARGGAGLLLHG